MGKEVYAKEGRGHCLPAAVKGLLRTCRECHDLIGTPFSVLGRGGDFCLSAWLRNSKFWRVSEMGDFKAEWVLSRLSRWPPRIAGNLLL